MIGKIKTLLQSLIYGIMNIGDPAKEHSPYLS